MFRDALLKLFDRTKIEDGPESLGQFSEDISFVQPCTPTLVISPENKEEVKAIVRLANNYHTPLVPVSSGPPRFRGDTIPEHGGVIVDLSKMNRILKIDSKHRYIMVEPGVTYAQLVPELRKKGMRLNMPFLPRGSKSVVTSYLEREPKIIPKYQYDDMDPLLTLEVVYGTGDDFRTGSASGPGTLESLKSDKVNPWGPGSIDYFRFLSGAQGTMGLVTWATIKTEVLPSFQKMYFIPAGDVDSLTQAMNMLLRKRVVDECLALNNVNLATVLSETWPGDFEELKENLPPWTLIVCLAGYQRFPEERVRVMEKYLSEICEGLGLKPQTKLPGTEIKGNTILELLSNPWDKKTYWKLRHKNACHDIFFLTTLSRVPEMIQSLKKIVLNCGYSYSDIGGYIQPTVQGRGCHCEFSLSCDHSNSEETASVRKLFMDASRALMNEGGFFSRPYGPWAEMVYSRKDEGVTALNKLKDIFDPNHILNPGKLCF